MDGIQLVYKLKKQIEETQKAVQTYVLNGQVDNHEKYKYLLGQAHAIQLTLQEISNLLKQKEQNETGGNIVDIKNRGTKT